MPYALFRPTRRKEKAGAGLVRYRGKLGKWFVGFTDSDGVVREKKVSANSQAEAERMAFDLERRYERFRLGLEKELKDDISFAIGTQLYIESLPPEYRSKQMLAGRFRNRINPHLGEILCRKMVPADVRRMLNANADVSPQTREHLRVAVQGCFTFLIDEHKLGGIEGNPAAAIEKVSIPETQPKFLRIEAIGPLLAAVPEQHLHIFLFNLGCATRKGEAFHLQWRNLDLEQGVAHVVGSHDNPTPKGKRSRTIPIPAWLVLVLRELKRTSRSRWVFPDSKGQQQKRWVKLHLIMKSALCRAGLVEGYDHACVTRGRAKSCGAEPVRRETAERIPCSTCGRLLWPTAVPIDISFKDLRSTFGTWAYAQTKDIRFVQQVLGHRDLQVTEKRYSHVLRENLIAQANAVSFGMDLSALALKLSGKDPVKRAEVEQ